MQVVKERGGLYGHPPRPVFSGLAVDKSRLPDPAESVKPALRDVRVRDVRVRDVRERVRAQACASASEHGGAHGLAKARPPIR